MKITYYRTTAYKNTDTKITDRITGTRPPEEMTPGDREELRNGAEPLACFQALDEETKSYIWHAVPWSFVISIEEDTSR